MRFLVQFGKSDFLQFTLNFLHADTFGKRRINIQRLAGNAGALFRSAEMQRAHVVQTIRQLNQQHADIFRHRQQQLAKIFRLFVVGRFLLDFCQFRQTVDNLRHLVAEQFADFLDRRIGVFNRIVQQSRNNGHRIKLEFGQDTGHLDRVRIIRVAGSAKLGAVLLHRKNIRTVQGVFIGVGIIGFNQIN